jgi:hypothetical protein
MIKMKDGHKASCDNVQQLGNDLDELNETKDQELDQNIGDSQVGSIKEGENNSEDKPG